VFLERGVLYFLLHKEHGMLAWSDRAANTSIQKYDGRADDRVAIRWRLRLSHPNRSGVERVVRGRALDISSSGTLVQELRPIDIGSLVRILRGNDLLTGTPYLRHCSQLDTAECHSKSAPW